MPTEETNVVTQNEEQPMSTRDMLLQALENAEAEEAPVEEAPVQEAPAEDVSEMPVPQPEQHYATREDVISAINNAMARNRQPEPQPEELNERAEEVTEAPEEEPEIEFDQEKFMDDFYDDPSMAIKNTVLPLADKIAEKKVKEVVSGIEKKLQPLLSQSEAAQYKDEVRSVISKFLNDTDDAKDYFTDMSSYIKQNGLDPKNEQSYLDAYRISKINRLGNENAQLRANQGKGLNDYLNDENGLSEIVNNDLVRQRVIDDYLNGLNKGDKPRTIGFGGSNNQPSAQPVNKARTMQDAKAMLIEQLSR